MQLINFTFQLFNPQDATFAGGRQTKNRRRMAYLLPGGLLLVAVAASLLLGSNVKPKDELAWLTNMANTGDTGAELQLGLAYRDGRYGMTPDPKTGLYWLRRSAAGGNDYAEDAVGQAYAEGKGVAQDMTQAEQWWRKAVNHGNHEARLHLADALIRAGHVSEGNALLN